MREQELHLALQSWHQAQLASGALHGGQVHVQHCQLQPLASGVWCCAQCTRSLHGMLSP